MIKRTVYVGNPAYLRLKHRQLEIVKAHDEVAGRIPVEDIAIVLLDNPQITITNALLSFLQMHNIVVITCDSSHLPLGFMLPCYGHTEHSAHLKSQIQASEPLKKQLWKQTVEAKIYNQQKLLEIYDKDFATMSSYLDRVSSGDATNMEGKAAQHYWKHLFVDFKREREGEPPNNLLNYGYAILRAMIARGLAGSGLLVSVGIFHSNKYNPYCLADDIMEPYRPFVDALVCQFLQRHRFKEVFELDTETKAHLLTLATEDVLIDNKVRPLFVAISTTTASLVKCFRGGKRKISYPQFVL